jgi:hypothetical protein
VWRTLQRLGSWVEPVLVNEWARLVRAYGERMGRMISLGEVEGALAWLDPARDTQLARPTLPLRTYLPCPTAFVGPGRLTVRAGTTAWGAMPAFGESCRRRGHAAVSLTVKGFG